MSRVFPGAAALAASALLALLPPGAAADPLVVKTDRIEQFHVRDPAKTYGELTFLGGLVLSAYDRRFGAFSSLLASPDGSELLTASDRGAWLSLTLRQDEDGTPLGVVSAEIAPRLSLDGRPPDDKGAGDAESLARRGDDILVSVEVGRLLLAYPGPDPIAATPRRLPLPAETSCLSANSGIEALAVAPETSPVAGSLVLIGERGCTRWPATLEGTRLPVWLVSPKGDVRRLMLVRTDAFRPTGAAFLPGGDLLVLERRYTGGLDIGMRIRRIGRDDLAGPGPIDGPVLMTADFAYEIDNMEGIAVSADAIGRPVITLISDDNRSLLQRTLLLRFRLELRVPEAKPAPDATAAPRSPT